MEDKPFKEVTLMTRHIGKMKVITSIMQAAEFLVNEWPGEETERLDIAKHALLEWHAVSRRCRMAFIDAATEADIYVEAVGRPPSTGKLEKWRKGKMWRAGRKPKFANKRVGWISMEWERVSTSGQGRACVVG